MDENRPSYYAIIPANVRYDDEISPNAKLLYGEISALIGKDGFCFASNQYFAELYRCTIKSVSRLISALVDSGYISVELEKDKSGQVKRRKIYLKVSLPDIQPVDNIVYTSGQDCGEGMDKIVQDTNTSITVSLEENKKEDADEQPKSKRAVPLTDGQLQTLCVEWVRGFPEDWWDRDTKNSLYLALLGFYAPREKKKQEPARTIAGFTALTNRLARLSGADPGVMIDMLERATAAGWKSVFPSSSSQNSTARQGKQSSDGSDVVCL